MQSLHFEQLHITLQLQRIPPFYPFSGFQLAPALISITEESTASLNPIPRTDKPAVQDVLLENTTEAPQAPAASTLGTGMWCCIPC